MDASAAVSWRNFKMMQARVELPHLAINRVAVGAQALWQDATQITYFGSGPATPATDRSEYRLKTGDVVGYGVVRPVRWFAVTGRVGWLAAPSILEPSGTFKRGNPATQQVFADNPVFTRGQQPDFVHAEISAAVDRRENRSHPTRGYIYRALAATYVDRDTGGFSFRRHELEAAHFHPLAGGRVVLALHAWLVACQTEGAATIPFYLEPSLGGSTTLRGYTDYRFHDRNLGLLTLETRFALMTHVDLAAFADAGNVAPRLSGLDLDKRTYGLGLRFHNIRSTFARLDVAHGADGWRVLIRTTEPLHLSRLSRRTAAVPFVP